ncbi:MAG: pyroglutamyl-peptidase [Phormidesmis priestleyi Ana]|uniref:Pyrrolidone-carboxylate peptidase n=1 Tax=Phormidesmis priestleyi Ana TaxID=1666911 RepID=A0A0P8DHK2_9CYAN|nr:MAG: pyroglutamyl-peptidase [Phormidesmis priestleyi Ana]
MKNGPVLITSFRPWRVQQRSNAANDLVAELNSRRRLPADTVWLSEVPVSFDVAPMYVISQIAQHRPRLVVCCGMAENRRLLSIERQAVERRVTTSPAETKAANKVPNQIHTSADLSNLLEGTRLSEISDDAGQYVCNHLYYRVLSFLNKSKWETMGVFIHIPILSHENKKLIQDDFVSIVAKLAAQSYCSPDSAA